MVGFSRNAQEFADFDNSHMQKTSVTARMNNSMLIGGRGDSPMLNHDQKSANQFIEETNDYLSK